MVEVRHNTRLLDQAILLGELRASKRQRALIHAQWIAVLPQLAWPILGILCLTLLMNSSHSDAKVGPRISVPVQQDQAPEVGKTVRDYVIFTSTDLPEGRIETGWHYTSEDQERPDSEWCQLIKPNTDGTRTIVPYEQMSDSFQAYCAWFDGRGA